MAENKELISAVGYFDGNSANGNFNVQIKFKFLERNLPDAIQFVAGIGHKLQLVAIVEEEKVKLGTFTVYNIRIDRDANCSITFKSNIDNCFVDNFSKLMVEETEITLKAKILEEEA